MLFPVRQEGLAKLVEFSAVVSPGKNKTCLYIVLILSLPSKLQHVSYYTSSDNTGLFTGLLPGSGAGWERFPSGDQRGTDCNHLITTLGCKAQLRYHQKQFRLKIPSFRTFFQARSVIPPDFTGCYLVNHPHPVD